MSTRSGHPPLSVWPLINYPSDALVQQYRIVSELQPPNTLLPNSPLTVGAEFSSDSSYTWIVHCSPQLHVHLCFTSCSACDSIPQYPQPHSSVSRACSPAPGWKLRRKSVLPEIPKSEGLFLAFVHCSSEPQYIRTSRTHSCRFPY